MFLQAGLLFAGNPDRIGQAGANELLLNPWARSAGFGGANSSQMTGLESMRFNVAGLAFIPKTQVGFSTSNYFGDSRMNSFGFGQRVGSSGVMGISVMSMSFGDIPVTTVDLPDGGLGNFRPQFLNLGLAYAREFSNSIYGGFVVRAISQSIADMRSTGVAFDAGIRYVTGENDNLKFGISIRNIGPKLDYAGDGLSISVNIDDKQLTLNQRADPYEMPAILNIGASYDILISQTEETGLGAIAIHRLTPAFTFTSNSFGKDQVRVGIEYSFRELFMIRSGYVYEEGIFSSVERTTAFTGLNVGATIQAPMNDNGTRFYVDYGYTATNPFGGLNYIGVGITL